MTKWATLLANYGKVVIVAGLNGDSYQKVSGNKHQQHNKQNSAVSRNGKV